jgi:hypothetical protein
MDQEKIANQMLELFHEHCRLWAVHQDGSDWPLTEAQNHGYYTNREIQVHDSTVLNGYYTVIVRQGVNDELHYFDLVGMVEDRAGLSPDELVYMTACVDTSWSEVWRAEYPHGLIDTTKPYEREGKFLHVPEEVKNP